MIHIRSTDDIQDSDVGDKEIVLVTIKQYLAVADDILRKLFPNVPEHIWAEVGEYPYCAVVISEGEPEGGPRLVQ